MILIAAMIDDEVDRNFMHMVYEINKQLMFSIAFRYTNNREDCEDIVHDAVEKLCGKVEKLKSLQGFALKSYVVRTVQNTAINHQKHNAILKRHEEELNDESYYTQDTPHARIERIEEIKKAKGQLTSIWDKLSAQDQELLYRKYVFNQGNDELANIFQCSKECIRMRLSRARKRALLRMAEEIKNDTV